MENLDLKHPNLMQHLEKKKNPIDLKLKFRKYPSIHTNYIISHSTILQYNHNI